MATLAEFALPLGALPLGVVCEEFPEANVELERVVPTADAVRQYFWVENVPTDSITAYLESQAAISTVTRVDRVDDRTLFRYQTDQDGDHGVLRALVDSDTTLLSAVGTREGWRLHVRGDVQRAVAAFDEECRAAGFQPTLRDLSASDPSLHRHPAVTDRQREALLLAYTSGYYADPRETDLSELAATVGISRQAFARRLSRGYRTLIESHLYLPTEDEYVT